MLSGPTNELDVVEDIVKKLDKVGAQSASVRVFKLKQAEPEKVVEILQSAMVRLISGESWMIQVPHACPMLLHWLACFVFSRQLDTDIHRFTQI